MKCDFCGKEFEFGNRPDGIPNGIALKGKDGSKTTICADCVIKEGRKKREREMGKEGVKYVQVFSILLSSDNAPEELMTNSAAEVIKANHGAFVEYGYNPAKYIGCLVFKTRLNRDRCAFRFEQMGIIYDTDDKAKIESKYVDLL